MSAHPVTCVAFTFLLVLSGAPDRTVADEVRVPGGRARFVLAGDSTVTDEAGWGRGFAAVLSDQTDCINLAKGGRSSRSFRTEGWWEDCLQKKPDFLLIQFGHNDQPGKGPERESAADGAFRDHLRSFVREAREVGCVPILVTPLTRRTWGADGRIASTLQAYAEATQAVAEELQVPLIDLHKRSLDWCKDLGPEAVRAFEPMTEAGADHTHLNADGSRAIGAIVAAELAAVLPGTAPFVDPVRLQKSLVPQPVARTASFGELSLEDTEEQVLIRKSGRLILAYNKRSPPVPEGIDAIHARSGFLHPVMSPAGRTVTAAFPFDHPHQQGVFSAWVRTKWMTREVDFWNTGGGTGCVLHQRLTATFASDSGVGFEANLVHRSLAEPAVDVLRERWKVTVRPSDNDRHVFDLETTQWNLTDSPLLIQKYHYGGLAVRGPVSWLADTDGDPGRQDSTPDSGPLTREPSGIRTDASPDRVSGNGQHARWVALSGALGGQPVCLAMLCHPNNFRSPQATRLHPTKPYFAFSPCVDGEFSIDRDHPYTARYRFVITDSMPDAAGLNAEWTSWSEAAPDLQGLGSGN